MMAETPFPRRHVAECASTNDLARAWAADATDPAPHGALVTADFQTRGRGRRGRVWDATAGESALMSFVMRSPIAPADAWHLGFVAALAVADALETFGLEPRLKWPNDVLVDGNKIAGVLVETVSGPPERAAIVGIGLNVNQAEFAGEESFLHPPTSLCLATGQEWAVESVIEGVATALAARVAEWEAQGIAPVLVAWRQTLASGVALRRGAQTAFLTNIADNGSAHVRLEDGTFAQWASVEGEEGANRVQ
ncbi:MAG: biotin--[acetyl-CoA-carboxylase] ligase [Armatimonadota bacterium]|nr:biotin--[acetyl-CoA-carboxylase] ligase [Armatimonadota bacterium]